MKLTLNGGWIGMALGAWLLLAAQAQGAAGLRHHLRVGIEPETGRLRVSDHIESAGPILDFWLHQGLDPRTPEGRRPQLVGREGHLAHYRIPTPDGQIELRYGGIIRHPLQGRQETPGITRWRSLGRISAEGIFLDGNSGWYPWVESALPRLDLEVDLPAGWLALSQGAGPEIVRGDGRSRIRWHGDHPQDDLYLVAGPYRLYRRPGPWAEAQVWLRRPDPDLAERYLKATARYLDFYSRLLGPYPYAKFALAENFWETGYGMPSFALLGPRVIRLPFILHTSLPHEILHDWWGNGVFPDPAGGNWSEGLTTYLADHLWRERRGRGAEYRRQALQDYQDFAAHGQDLPLQAFRARHGGASQAVGYGKGLFFFHMLRRILGDRTFIEGLRRFYAQRRFTTSAYDDLRQAFEATSGRDLGHFFRQWTERTGAPELVLEDVQVSPEGTVSGRIRQTQTAPPFPLHLPLVVHRASGPSWHWLDMDGREANFRLHGDGRPLRLDLDPRWDLFRRLYPEESPPVLSGLLGASECLLVLPAAASPALHAAYRRLARDWVRGRPGWQVAEDRDLKALPEDRPAWLLGWANRFLKDFARRLPDSGLPRPQADRAFVLVAADRKGPAQAWLAADSPGTVPGLTRKVPHYGHYAHLAFAGETPQLVEKGTWPLRDSPLTRIFAKGAEALEPPPEGPPLGPEDRPEPASDPER